MLFIYIVVVSLVGVMYIVFIITNNYSLGPTRFFLVFVLYPILYECAKHVVLC